MSTGEEMAEGELPVVMCFFLVLYYGWDCLPFLYMEETEAGVETGEGEVTRQGHITQKEWV